MTIPLQGPRCQGRSFRHRSDGGRCRGRWDRHRKTAGSRCHGECPAEEVEGQRDAAAQTRLLPVAESEIYTTAPDNNGCVIVTHCSATHLVHRH